MESKSKVIRELEDYLKTFIVRFKDHDHLNLLDISHHLTAIRELDKRLKLADTFGRVMR